MAGLKRGPSIVRNFPTKPALPKPISQRHQSDDIDEAESNGHTSLNPHAEEMSVCLQLSHDKANEYETPISQLVTNLKLPTVVQLQRGFPVARGGPLLKTGQLLLLHFIGQQRRIPAKDDLGNETWLFLDDTAQLFDILPHDPALDLKQFQGTDAVIKSNPLPKWLRIVKMSPKYKEDYGLYEEAVLEISHVESETQNYKRSNLQRLVGSCDGKQFILTQHTTDIVYSTIISQERLPLSTVVERNLRPVRLRQANGNRVYSLQQEPESVELQVIATLMGHDRVLAIPLSCPIEIKRAANEVTEELLQGMLPAIYSLVHYTGKVQRVEAKPEEGNPSPKGPKPVELPHSNKHFFSLENFRDLPQRSKATTYVQLKEGYSPEAPNVKPALKPKPKPKPATGSKSFVTLRTKPLALLPVYDEASSPVVTSSEPEETQPIYDDASSFDSSRPNEDDETQPVYDDVPFVERFCPDPHEDQGIYDDASSLEVSSYRSEDSLPIYDDASVSVLPDRAHVPPFSERKKKSMLELHYPQKSTDDEYSLRSASVDEVADFLRKNSFESWIDTFRAVPIDGKLLYRLDDTYLVQEMGMGRIEAKRLLLAVRKTTKPSKEQGEFNNVDANVRRTKSLSMKHTFGRSMKLFKKQTSGEF